MIRKKIYVASSWRNDYHGYVVNTLKSYSHSVYNFRDPAYSFHWSQIDINWENWKFGNYLEGLKHPLAKDGFKNDYEAMKWSDLCVLVLPCGKSAHLEAGWFLGNGKKLFILLEKEKTEPELMYKMADLITDDLGDILDRLRDE